MYVTFQAWSCVIQGTVSQDTREEDSQGKNSLRFDSESLMYAMLCTKPDIYFAVAMVRRYQSNPSPEHWTAVKHILKYLRRTKDYMLMYGRDEFIPVGYTDLDFMSDKKLRKSTSGHLFTLGGGTVSCRRIKKNALQT